MNLVDGALGYVSTAVIEKASELVGESPAGTRRALQIAVPSIVAALAGHASEEGGPTRILRAVEEAGLSGPEAAVSERLGAGGGEDLIETGKALIGRLFGERLGATTHAAARAAGVAPDSMERLTDLSAPLVFGALGSAIHARHLDAAGVAGLLGAQRGPAVAALPAAVAAAVPGEGAHVAGLADEKTARPLGSAARPSKLPRPAPSTGRYWPLLLLIPAAVLVGLFFRRPATETTRTPARLGAGLPSATVTDDTALGDEVAAFLASPTGDATRRFTLGDLAFDTATSELTPRALAVIDGVASALKAYPGAVVLVEGHTDSRGDAADNLLLSMRRAEEVKQALIARGVSEDRISTAGIGQDRPIASNDTPEGRAQNRRTELVITR